MDNNFKFIIKAALLGDESAYEALYTMTKDSAYFIALNITHNEQDALDILQESYIKAFTHLDTVDPPELFDHWFSQIVSNCSKDYIKKKKPLLFSEISEELSLEEFSEETDSDLIPHEYVDKQEASRLLMDIINKLPENKRLVILMYYYQNMNTSEIADTLALPLTTVKYYLLEARKEIKAELERLDKEGTRLYAILPFALFPTLIGLSAAQFNAPAFSAVSTPVMGAVTGSAVSTVSSYTNSAAGDTAGNTATSHNAGTGSVAAPTTSVGSSAPASAANTAGGIGKLFKTTTSKVIAGIAAAAVVTGGVAATVAISNNKTNKAVQSSQVSLLSEKSEESEESKKSEESIIKQVTNYSPASDFEYTIENNNVTITKYIGNDETVIIPKEINGKPVTALKGSEDGKMGCFQRCASVKSIVIPDGISMIGNYLFSDCTSLEEILIPDSVTKIGEFSFNNCNSLKTVVIPKNVTAIGLSAFNNCSSIESITIPERVTTLERAVFNNCSKLREIILPENLTTVSSNAFAQCVSLENIAIPDTVTLLGDYSFSYCSGLKHVNIPKGISSITLGTFSNCTSLKKIEIPENIEVISTQAFGSCTSLEEVIISNGVSSISSYSFAECNSLKNVTIPKSVTEIDDKCIPNNSELTIHGSPLSQAFSYAKSNNINFDGELTFADFEDGHFHAGVSFQDDLKINSDGSFSGVYDDGVNDEVEKNGVICNSAHYHSEYNGKFSDLKKINETTYSCDIVNINYPNEGKYEIKDNEEHYGMKYLDEYTKSPVFESIGKTIYIYLPGTNADDVPEEEYGYSYGPDIDSDTNTLKACFLSKGFTFIYNQNYQ